MSITVKVPASSANLGPGFDVFGLALSLYNQVEVEPDAQDSLIIVGEGKEILPRGADNLLIKTINWFYQRETDKKRPPLRIKAINSIPLSRGLGSSAAAIVAGLTVADKLSGRGLSRKQLFDIAVSLEGHPDNVAAAVYGGFTIAYSPEGTVGSQVVSLKPHPELAVLLLIPKSGLATETARRVLPEKVSYADAVFNISRAALLAKVFLQGDFNLMAAATADKLHQPYRLRLMPELSRVIDLCRQAGADGAALSGAGPSVIVFTRREASKLIGEKIKAQLQMGNLNYTVKAIAIDLQGATVL